MIRYNSYTYFVNFVSKYKYINKKNILTHNTTINTAISFLHNIIAIQHEYTNSNKGGVQNTINTLQTNCL